MNILKDQFNLKGELLSLTSPLYLKNYQKEDARNDNKIPQPKTTNLWKWYFEIGVDQSPIPNSKYLYWNNIRSKQPLLLIWIASERYNGISPELIAVADFIVDNSSKEEIAKIPKIGLENIPIGIPLIISDVFVGNQKIHEKNLMVILDELLVKINCWRQIGVKDLFIDIDFKDSLERITLFSVLKNLKILKHLNVPISAKIPSLVYFKDQVGLEILVEFLFDLGCKIIRTNDCRKMTQLVSFWEKRISLENGN